MSAVSIITPPTIIISRREPSFPLPPYRFVPKVNPHPLKDPKGHMFGQETLWDSYTEKQRWNIGVDFFNNHYFWEAHEVWEGLWREKDSSEKDFLQAMILLSASLLQEHLGRISISKKSVIRAISLISAPQYWSEKYQFDLLTLLDTFRTRHSEHPFPKIETLSIIERDS